jgi:hypothetical protein
MTSRIRRRSTFVLLLGAASALHAQTAEESNAVINRIIDEGFNRSEVAATAAYLTDRIGGRLTNSPAMRAAEEWTQRRFREWGLENVRAEGFDFGRGWSIESSDARLVEPRIKRYRAIPIAWTPGTNGPIRAPIVVAPLERDRDFDEWRGKLRGAIVLVTQPDEGSEPTEPPFRRRTDEDLAKLNEYPQPRTPPEEDFERRIRRSTFEARRDAFLAGEGALAWVEKARRDGGLLHGEGYAHRVGETPRLPGFELAAEDYRQLARLAKTDAPPVLELASEVAFHDDDHNAYNVLADLPGRDASAGYVMAGAHLDSWVGADGAQDNAAGSAVVMEAARLLAALDLRARRTIRFALWSGEEQGLNGSIAYAEQHLAERAPLEGERAKLPRSLTWNQRWPITPRREHASLGAYFNIDNGSGKVRGIFAEGNVAVAPIFREWLAPFASMGATAVVTQRTGGTDHVPMQQIGIPAFQFVQDPLDYSARIHHTSIDTYDHLKLDDMRQAAVILASLLWLAAEREEPLPRMPLPTRPAQTDPFEYLEDEG